MLFPKLKSLRLAMCTVATVFCLFADVYAQPLAKPAHQWSANWIAMRGSTGNVYGIYYFRKNITLDQKPSSFKVHVSADNRYKLYVNQTLVSLGPARGDIYSWNYETVDLAPYLKAGKNTIAALVFNEAEFKPVAQISIRTGFMLQGSSPAEDIINTNRSWKCAEEKAYNPFPGWFPIAASKGEIVDMNTVTDDWNAIDFDDSNWRAAEDVFAARPKGNGDDSGPMLVPSPLPAMELSYQRISTLRKATGMAIPAGFPKTKTPLTIPARSVVNLLLDQDTLTNAYLTLNFSGGKNATLTARYAETLYEKRTNAGRIKGDRNAVEGKDFIGRGDSVIANGKPAQTYTTLYWRTYRYIQLTIRTGDEALTLDDIYGTFTGYPFKLKSKLNTDNKELQQILDIGWRTARLCAIETYFDCPYYEQLQYVGDTRIQAMVSYYNAGNDTLARNAINQIDGSRLPEGITQSRWPSNGSQVIPGFSLWHIGMVYDYWMYRNDAAFVKSKLDGARAILGFFERYQQPDGSLKGVPFWTYEDWVSGHNWDRGAPRKGADGSYALIDLQLLMAYQWMAQMEAQLGMPAYAALYRTKAAQLTQTIRKKYWNASKQLFAETVEKNTYSQHTNSLAILTGVAAAAQWATIGKKVLDDAALAKCSIYFKYYLHSALVKAGLGNQYLQWLDVWREDIKLGLTTWAEEPDPLRSRSDCHAWGSSPNVEVYRTLLGIDSDAPGFQKVLVSPHLGDVKNISGSMPHPNGSISTSYLLKGSKWQIKIALPAKTTGRLAWKGKYYPLKAGENLLVL